VAGVLAAHVGQLRGLVLTGVADSPHWSAVRVFVNSDFPTVGNMTDHQAHSASLPRSFLLGGMCSSARRCMVVAALNSLRDLASTYLLSTAAHLREIRTALKSLEQASGGLGLGNRSSIERSPVIIAPPSQVASFPLLLLCRLSLRILSLRI